MKVARSEAKRTSAKSAAAKPRPAVGPFSAATIGLRTESRYDHGPRKEAPIEGSPGSACSSLVSPKPRPSPIAWRSFRSAPAQKPRPAPVSTIATTAGSASARATACLISPSIRRVIAFRRSGRFR